MNGSGSMTKLIVIPTTIKQIYDLISFGDGYILGIKGLSVNMPSYFELNEIKEVIKYLKENNKKVFISLNKNLHNKDLIKVQVCVLELNKLEIDGVFYYDIGIVNIKNRLDLNFDLIWSQEHLTTNYSTCNYWYNFGVKYAYLSNEITLDEIVNIKKETKMGLFVNVLGYLPMFTSKRHLVDNYLKTFSLKGSDNYHIFKEGNSYPIVDNNDGTTVYSSKILNAFDEYLEFKKNNIDYCVLNSFLINNNDFEEIVKCFNGVNEDNKEELSNKINNLLDNKWDKGFLYKETVYKVKKNDKDN